MPSYRVPTKTVDGVSQPAHSPGHPSDSYSYFYESGFSHVRIDTDYVWEDRPDDVDVLEEADDAASYESNPGSDGEDDDADDEDGEDEGPPYVCEECGDSFETRAGLHGHLSKHS